MKSAAGLLSLCLFAAGAQAFVGHAWLHARSLSSPSSVEARGLRVTSSRPRAIEAPSRRTGRRVAVTCMGETVWSKTTVVETSEVATDQYAITIKSGDIAKEYQIPGQYVQLRVGEGKPGYFAIASPPCPEGDTDGLLEFLVKAVESTTPLVTAKPGDAIDMSPVMGGGFPIKENFSGYKFDFPVQNVLLAASGTGIAPFRAAIESGVLELPDEEDDGVFGRSCRLYFGCKDEESMPWKEKMKEWDGRGVEVVPVLSDPSSSWTGRKGFVQDAMKEDGIRVPRNTGVLVCGHPAMTEEVKALAATAGVLDGRVLTNY